MKGARLRLLFFTVLLLVTTIICMCEAHKSKDNDSLEAIGPPEIEVQDAIEIHITEAEDNKQSYIKFQDRMSMDWDSEDAYLLAKIAMAEAEGESIEGKALVILVVLNRMIDDSFPDTIYDVIFQKSNTGVCQFSPTGDGRWEKVEPNEDCWKALNMIMQGYDESYGALYFTSSKEANTWHSRNLEYLFQEGNHKFYK